MPQYRVSIPKVIWLVAKVEAEDEELAIEAAHDIAPSLCAHCSGWGQEQWAVDEDDWGGIGDLHENFRSFAEEIVSDAS